ncbi:hypothetical protein TCAL_11080 [Tigriopus californicus]|uniref:Luciferin 4-monooxygenase n=1 Tax=Tigriopus californicus TaxID=6832 RepID=A0A553N6M0_TIGCA|nr:hypothetical protein TCAL_11080 [Tigriopus californicus]|eukprot:TCALIF_11080-PA protein Name:"Similar to 4CL1 4-coumarate--CoA ligase 1 (Nicotiana tabacum)" AED:0.11 eAED:0.11 QI:99/0.71/0.62/1/0.57/0.62/8/0/575
MSFSKFLAPRLGSRISDSSRRWLSITRCAQSEEHTVKSDIKSVQYPREHLTDFIWKRSVQQWPQKTALVNGLLGQEYTYQESYDRVQNVATALHQMGVRKGEVMALFLPNLVDYPIIIGGANRVGMVVTTVNPTYTPSEVARQLTMSKAKILVTMAPFLVTAKEALTKVEGGSDITIIVVDGDDHRSDQELSYCKLLVQSRCQSFPDDADSFNFSNDIVTLPYSSGTTGPPKGVMLSHENIVSNIVQSVYPDELEFLKFATEEFQPSTVCVLPLFHAFGLAVTTLPTLHVGGKVVLLPSFDPKTFLKALEDYKASPSFLHFAPPLVGFCANHPDVKPHHLESVESVFVGAAPLGKALIDRFLKKAPQVKIREGFGMTELSPVGTITPNKSIVEGSCGLLMPNTEMKIVDLSTGTNLPSGKRGELCIKGPQVMKGYLDNDKATAQTIKNGWLHTGDIAYYDDQHYIYIVDRLKELIKVSGFQVPPAELEDLLRTHPSVLDVAVIGIPDERRGEVPRAYIVIKPQQALTEEEVHEFVNKQVAEYKRLLGGMEFVEVIPKSAAGKILRKDLVARFKSQ